MMPECSGRGSTLRSLNGQWNRVGQSQSFGDVKLRESPGGAGGVSLDNKDADECRGRLWIR